MHADEVHTDASLVRRLLAAQFPQWSDLPIERVESSGTDNALYRLGDAMVARLPRIGWARRLVEKEARWLPVLAPHLPLPIPVPIAIGEPGEGYPWRWYIAPWFEGENATIDRLDDPRQAAIDLAEFLNALWRIDATDGPRAGPANFYRGVPLAEREEGVRAAVPEWRGIVDTDALTAAWDAALAAPQWDRSPVWVHGDLSTLNLLTSDERLSAVIDFGCLGVGDPACDLIIAWELFEGESRAAFRAALAVDDATWARGRGWALRSVGALPYYKDTNRPLVASARRKIEQVLEET